jgi:hypothetical protein
MLQGSLAGGGWLTAVSYPAPSVAVSRTAASAVAPSSPMPGTSRSLPPSQRPPAARGLARCAGSVGRRGRQPCGQLASERMRGRPISKSRKGVQMIEALGVTLGSGLAILLVTFAGPLAAGAFLARSRKAARAARRSPLTSDLLRPPGYTLRERIDDIRMDLAFDVAILMVMPTVLVALYLLLRVVSPNPPSSWVAVALVLGIAAFVACWTRKLLRADAEMDKLRKGLDAEMAVGQELDQLIGQGARVFHDLPAETFNIDHIVVSRQGVFCVETKAIRNHWACPAPPRPGWSSMGTPFDFLTSRRPSRWSRRPGKRSGYHSGCPVHWGHRSQRSPCSRFPAGMSN